MKDVGKDHKVIVDRLASTLDGLRRTFDPAWDVMREKDTTPIGGGHVQAHDANVEILGDAGSFSGIENQSPSQMIHRNTGWFHISSFSALCCQFWGRMSLIYICVLLIVLLLDWYFFHHRRQKQSLSRMTRGQQASASSYSWTRTALKYALFCGVMIVVFAGSLLYKVDATTIPHHLFRMM
jgi:hypothetical protein